MLEVSGQLAGTSFDDFLLDTSFKFIFLEDVLTGMLSLGVQELR